MKPTDSASAPSTIGPRAPRFTPQVPGFQPPRQPLRARPIVVRPAWLGLAVVLAVGTANTCFAEPGTSPCLPDTFGCATWCHPTLTGVTCGDGVWVAVAREGTILTLSRDSDSKPRARTAHLEPEGTGSTADPGAAVALDGLALTRALTDAGPQPRLRVRNIQVTGFKLQAVTYAHGLFVIVGDRGAILTSPDGVHWTQQTAPTTQALWAVAAGAGVGFIAVGASGTILRSTDGIHWTERDSGVGDALRGVCFGPHGFVAVGSRQTILSSADGIHWTRVGSLGSLSLKQVTAGPDGYTAVGCGHILISSDGRHWGHASPGGSNLLLGMTHGPSWVAVGKAGRILTSIDSQTWTPTESGITLDLLSVYHADGLFVAVGRYATMLWSANALDWH